MTVITVRVDEELKKMMEIKVNWSSLIRNAIETRIEEERRRNLAKAVLINEKLRRRSKGEAKAEEIIRKFREGRYDYSSS
jgi:polyribonucleotide nucleotidyltransferase